MNSFQVLFSNFNLRRYSTAHYATSCQGEWKLVVDVHLGRAVQVDSIKTRVESSYGFCA